MSPFQRARNEANLLRQKLLGHSAAIGVSTTDLFLEIEERLELAIEHVPLSYGALGGGSAVLKRNEGFIYVRNDVSQDKSAFLIAHELGHWVLDESKPATTIAHLKSLTESDGSPATLTVEAYGARERQELQANLFARELLLPRAVAKALFAAGESARTIAAKFQIPLECVRLQLLDALLLPDYEGPSAGKLPLPSPDQYAAARASERFVNVVAGPGTGKTTTLVHRIKYLVEELKVDPSEILVLTFTNKAAYELIERLRNSGMKRAADIWAGTFHAFGLEFLRKYHQYFDLEPNLGVADRLNEMALLVKALPQVKLEYYLRVQDPYDWLQQVINSIKRLKEELVSPKQYKDRVSCLPAESEDLRLQRQDIASLYELHEAALQTARTVDFVDLVAKPALALKNDRTAFSELTSRYKHVLVDEYQDVTEAMVALVRQLSVSATSLWVVGDVRQAIHHWRGASVRSLLKFEETFRASAPGKVQKYSLTSNRRSSREILEVFSAAGKAHVLQSSLPLDDMDALKGASGLKPVLVSCKTRADIADAIVRGIQRSIEDGVGFAEQAVLCRKGADVEHIAEHLRSAGIPTLYIGELIQRREVKRFLCLMQILCERKPSALVGFADDAALSMPLDDIRELLQFAEEGISWQRGRWLKSAPSTLSPGGCEVWLHLQTLLKGFSRHSSPWDFVCDLMFERRFGLPDQSDVSLAAQLSRLALWQFAYAVRNGDGDVKQARLSRYLMRQQLRQRVGDAYVDRELPPEAAAMDAVRILTTHGSKGLEYEAVHVGYVDAGSYGPESPKWVGSDSITLLVPPEVLGSNKGEYEFETAVERNNLLYVGLSRPKRHLYVYEDLEFSGKNRAPQLDEFRVLFARYSFGDATEAVTHSSNSGATHPGAASFDELETYARCPLQHYYRYILDLHREQDIDISVRARFAIMDALRVVAAEAVVAADALVAAWAKYHLPEASEDPSLWSDANAVLYKGLAVIVMHPGVVREDLVADLGGLEVVLPWAIEAEDPFGRPAFHLFRFSASSADSAATLLRPMVNGMSAQSTTVHSLLPSKDWPVARAVAPAKTKAMKAAVKMLQGDRNATKGRHCARCAYLSICPSVVNS